MIYRKRSLNKKKPPTNNKMRTEPTANMIGTLLTYCSSYFEEGAIRMVTGQAETDKGMPVTEEDSRVATFTK